MQLMPSKCNLFSFNRVKQLDRFHFVILQEIENFEKDSQSLNNMEKELLVCSLITLSWKKTSSWEIYGSFIGSLTLHH